MDLSCFEHLKTIVDPFAALAAMGTLPFAAWTYWKATRKEQQDRERGTYDSLDEKYVEFLQLSIHHPELDIFERPLAGAPELEHPHQLLQQLAAFNILLSIFERAYLRYQGESGKLRERQWEGWRDSIRQYTQRENFRRAWRLSGNGFDTAFQKFLQDEYSLPPPETA
jgi:hypothetical protein